LPPTPASHRVIRGGWFSSNASYLLPPTRGYNNPSNRDYDFGFRCARTP